MAYRAGAEISDMEFIQFHPTALYLANAPRFLLSEALRGEGAYLRNSQQQRFMSKYHELGELAPRDVVARAIVHELEISTAKDPVVYLDLRHLDADVMKSRFPRIYSTCLQYKIDITTDLIPVRPAAHYAMGGVRTDLDGRASIAGLYAAGEVAATGVHGANRLASNSLLEGLVFGARAGKVMRETASSDVRHNDNAKHNSFTSDDKNIESTIHEIQDSMWKHVGIARDAEGLKREIDILESLAPKVAYPLTRRAHEARNLQTIGLLVAKSALAREESRGAHYRTDFPAHHDGKFLKHSVIRKDSLKNESVKFE